MNLWDIIIALEMHCMWFMWFSYKRYKSQVPCKIKIYFVVGDEIGQFIYENYNASTKMVCLNHGSGDFYLMCWYVLSV